MDPRDRDSLLDRLVERLDGPETLDLEFKLATGGLPKSLWATVSAFANTRGGWIVLGVFADDGRTEIRGVSKPHDLVQDYFNLIRNRQKVSTPVCGVDDASVEELDGRDLVVIRVPAASRRDRPVYLGGNPYTGTFVRRSSGDYQCTKPEVNRMMREASDITADSTILPPSYGIDDLEAGTVSSYRRRFQTLNPTHPWVAYDDSRFLAAVGAIGTDRSTGRSGLTVAGLLLAGNTAAIRSWRQRHLIDFRLTEDDVSRDGDSRWIDRVPFEGNLLDAFDEIYPRLTAGQAVPFRLDGATRVDESSVHVALRESFVNLLVHADYSESAASLIVVAAAGYEFRNPGSSRVGESDLLTGDRSDPRNPTIVRMFRLIGLAEEAGTGIPKVLRTWRQLGWKLPEIDVGTERYEFSLRLRHAHMLSEGDREWLAGLGTNWTESEQLALVTARHAEFVDNITLRRLTGEHAADVTRTLGGLRDRGLLQMLSGGRGARYQLGPASTGGLGPLFEDPVADAETRLLSLGEAEQALRATSEGRVLDSEDNPSSSTGIDWSELRRVALPTETHARLDPLVRDAIVLELCSRAPLSLGELATLIHRSVPYTRDVLRALMLSGRVSFTYPDRPSHPHQRYQTTRS